MSEPVRTVRAMSSMLVFVPPPPGPVPPPNPLRAEPTPAFRAARRTDPRLGPGHTRSRWRDPAEIARAQAAEARQERASVEADPRAAAILALREARAEKELSITISPAAEAWPGLDSPAHDLASRRQALARFQAAEYRDQRQVS
jgi:hypothetical protein